MEAEESNKKSLMTSNGKPSLFSYKNLVYGATALTGFSALCGQVVWQKYLAILVGSEARSMSLVIAVFLLGLASGYYFFGKLTEKREWPRFRLLKIYGYIEWATAVYLFSFHLYYQNLEWLSFNSPAVLIMDILIAFLALFFPTFLMGASIPLLTATVPDRPEEINFIHSRIYGWNTLGAFLGTLLAGFYLVPSFGFPLTLIIAGAVNFLAALVFVGNPLEGMTRKTEDIPSVPSRLSNRFYMIFVFLTGAVVISLEILFVRLLNVSAGAGVYNFPLVLSLFVGGLGLGSLFLPEKVSPGYFIRQIFLSAVFLAAACFTGPYWSVWFSHIRVALTTISFNWYVFKVETWLFLFLFIFPLAFFMGRLLPLSYSFLKKGRGDYGVLCGWLYFFNTLGTVFGAVVIGYLAFYFLDLDNLFKINLAVLIILFGIVAFWEKRRFVGGFAVICLVGLVFMPPWDRTGHIIGYFRRRTMDSWHFQKVFHLPKTTKAIAAFFDDGPNTTVSILTYPSETEVERIRKVQGVVPEIVNSYSVIVNGKSDGHSINDFSTVALLSSLGYLFLPEKPALSSAVVGLGTGISAGILGKLEDMKEVVVLEISPAVISGLESIPFNFDFKSNPKVRIVERDAFRYFSGTGKKFDFIVSEPSNPWVTGVENLFAREFYRLVKQKLNEGGVLAQWLHNYSMDQNTFQMICHTIKQEFKYVEVYLIGHRDVVILAGKSPFHYGETVNKRFSNSVLFPLHVSFGLFDPGDLNLIRILDADRFAKAHFQEAGFHSLTVPRLTYQADKAFFLGTSIEESDIFSGPIPPSSEVETARIQRFKKYLTTREEVKNRCFSESGFSYFCSYISRKFDRYDIYKDQEESLSMRFASYGRLRNLGLIDYDKPLMEEVREWIIREKISEISFLLTYVHQFVAFRGYEGILADISDFQLDASVKEKLTGYIKELQKEKWQTHQR